MRFYYYFGSLNEFNGESKERTIRAITGTEGDGSRLRIVMNN